MAENYQELEQQDEIHRMWLGRNKQDAKARPPLHKIEVRKPTLKGAKWTFTVIYWTGSDLRRVTFSQDDPEGWALRASQKCELDWQAYQANLNGIVPF